MKRYFIAASWQAAALAAVVLGGAAFLWAPDSHWLWLAGSALLVAIVPLSWICLQSAAIRALTGGKQSFGFQVMVAALLVAGVGLVWRFGGRWYGWALFWLAVPPVLGPAFAAGRWVRPRFSFWFVGAALVPTLLMNWAPRLENVTVDSALFIFRIVLAGAILVGGLVMAMNDWAPRDSAPAKAAVKE